MPQALPLIIGAAATSFAVSAGIVAAGSIGAAIIGTIASGLTSVLLNKSVSLNQSAARPGAGVPGGGSSVRASQLLVNNRGGTNALPIIYGLNRRIGGQIVYLGSSAGYLGTGTNEQFLQIVVCLGEGPLEQITDVYFDGTRIGYFDGIPFGSEFDSDHGRFTNFTFDEDYKAFVLAEYSITSSQLAEHIYIEAKRGNFGQVVRTRMINGIGPSWDSDRFGAYTAYLWVQLKYNTQLFPGLPNIQVKVKSGLKVNPVNRYAESADGSWYLTGDDLNIVPGQKEGFQVITVGDSDLYNPANIIADYLRIDFGREIPTTSLDLASFQQARLDFKDRNIRLDIVLNPDETVYRNVEKLLANTSSILVYSNGKYKLKVWPPDSSEYDSNTFVFSEDNILGAWSIIGPEYSQTFGSFRVNYYDRSQGDQPNIFKYSDPSDSAQNLNAELELDLEGQTYVIDAAKISYGKMMESRYGTVVSFSGSHQALQLEPGDPVYITHDLPGCTNKKFVVSKLVLRADNTVGVELIEYPENVYPIDTTIFEAGLDSGITEIDWYDPVYPRVEIEQNVLGFSDTNNSTTYSGKIKTGWIVDSADTVALLITATNTVLSANTLTSCTIGGKTGIIAVQADAGTNFPPMAAIAYVSGVDSADSGLDFSLTFNTTQTYATVAAVRMRSINHDSTGVSLFTTRTAETTSSHTELVPLGVQVPDGSVVLVSNTGSTTLFLTGDNETVYTVQRIFGPGTGDQWYSEIRFQDDNVVAKTQNASAINEEATAIAVFTIG